MSKLQQQAGSLLHEYKPFCFNQALMTGDIEFSEEMFIITKESAEAYVKAKDSNRTAPEPEPSTSATPDKPKSPDLSQPPQGKPVTPPEQLTFSGMSWSGEIPPQKWMNFYTKVLSKFASGKGLKLTLKVEAKPEGGISKQKMEETKAALRELGLNDKIEPE